jgi:CBS domain-containing protein
MKTPTLADMITDMQVHTVSPKETLRNACIMMSSANVGALPVVNDEGALVGMLSERDVIQRSVIVYRPSESTQVDKVMTPDPKWLPPEAKPDEAQRIMLAGHFRHLPVCKKGQVIGIVSLRDFDMRSKSILAQLREASGKGKAGR